MRWSSACASKGDLHFSTVGTCRVLLESATRNYISDHVRYVSHTKNPKCTYCMTVKCTTISDALDHMQACTGALESWRIFKKNAKLTTSGPGESVYSQLSDYMHTQMFSKENVVSIPEWLEPVMKRFLLRLFIAKSFKVNIVDARGEIREPVPKEFETSPQTSPSNKRCRPDGADEVKQKKSKKSKKKEKGTHDQLSE